MATPKLDKRSIGDIVETAKALAQRYVADWAGVDNAADPGRQVIALFARLMEILIERENRVLEKNFLKFLDLVGIEQFPGSPATAPVTFVLARDAAAGAPVPVRTQVATTQTESSDAQVFETTTAFYATPARIVQVVNLVPAVEGYTEVALGELPPTSAWLADKSRATVALSAGAGDLKPVQHVLYLASQALFGRADVVDVVLVFTLAAGAAAALSSAHVTWQRFDAKTKRWINLETVDVALGPSEVRLRLRGLAGGGSTTVHGHEGYFIAGSLDGASAAGLTWPTVLQVTGFPQASGAAVAGAPDFAFANAHALDLSKPFLPFGERPRYGDAFYIGSRAAFSPEVSTVTFECTILPYTNAELLALFAGIEHQGLPVSITTDLEWQYLRADGTWQSIAAFRHTITATPGTPNTVAKSAQVLSGALNAAVLEGEGTLFGAVASDGAQVIRLRLVLEPDIGLQTVNGAEAYWLRAILRSRHPYGSDGFVIPGVAQMGLTPAQPPVFVGPFYVSPTVETLGIVSTHRNDPSPLDQVITVNNFNVVNETTRLAAPAASFRPFVPVPAQALDGTSSVFAGEPALYIGLDRALDNAFASLFIHLDESTSLTTAPVESGDPRLVWEYLASGARWRPIDVIDGTANLTTSGTVGFLAPSDAGRLTLFPLLLRAESPDTAPALCWLRARLANGTYDYAPRLLGIYLNTVLAENRATVSSDVLIGSGNGKPRQIVSLVQTSILAGELWVREPERPSEDDLTLLRDDILATLRLDDPDVALEVEALVDRRESSTGETELWVRWHRVPNFLSSGPRSRHYTLNRVHGLLGIGDGRQGLIPPISKDNLVLRGFASGGGEDANLVATPLAIKQLKTSLPFVNKVFNPLQATGGAAAWSLEDTRRFGPSSIKHRGRAVTTEDYAWMIRERFGQVAKVRCLPTRAPGGGGLVFQPGAVTAIVVPKSAERLPQPSNGLLRTIRAYLQEKTLGSIVNSVHVIGPSFQPVSVTASVKTSAPQEASLLVRRVTSTLENWFHPLSGGDAGTGWEFGRAVYLSEVLAIIAGVPGVDHIQAASFTAAPLANVIPVSENSLTASGMHVIEVS